MSKSDFRVYNYSFNGEVETIPGDNIPLIRWPNGQWCFLANIYLKELFDRGLSRKDRGGTLLVYATYISHLIRFCYYNQIDFHNITDNIFTLFIKALQGENRENAKHTVKRNANSVIDIGRACLDFLRCVGLFYLDENLISPNGRIRVQKKKLIIRRDGFNKTIYKEYWHHHSFPTPDQEKKRLPISTENIQKLREAVLPASNSIYIRRRRYIMLNLLETLGPRRYEIARITVESINEAKKMKDPMLKLSTVKKRGGKYTERLVPITKVDLSSLVEFIDKSRNPLISRCYNKNNKFKDDGFLLVSETSGKRLASNTITQEIEILRKQAGINEVTCAHMFRHRYITKRFVALIEQYNLENVDDFKKALLDTETLKQKITEWTGHSDPRSLDVYLHLAFDEVTNYKKVYTILNASQVIESLDTKLQILDNELNADLTPAETFLKLQRFIEAARQDIKNVTAISH